MGAADAARETKRLQRIRWAGLSMCNREAHGCVIIHTSAVQQSMSLCAAQTALPAQQGSCRLQSDMEADLSAKSCCVASPSVPPVAPSHLMSADHNSQEGGLLVLLGLKG